MPLRSHTPSIVRILAAALVCALGLVLGLGAGASEAAPSAQTLPEGAPPFIFPFEGPPGPDSWMLGQLYGNTTGAYYLGDVWYAAGQGLHFGIDVLAPCGTPVLSIGEGRVVQADWMARGAGPHNLVVEYPAQGVTALYGHLLGRPELAPGEAIAQGQVIGLSGDPDVTCDSRPHLHLEIRDPSYTVAYNPIAWIDADWDALMLAGPFSEIQFVRDLADPLRWTRMEDQPDVQFGGARVNSYPQAWPSERGDGACVVTSC